MEHEAMKRPETEGEALKKFGDTIIQALESRDAAAAAIVRQLVDALEADENEMVVATFALRPGYDHHDALEAAIAQNRIALTAARAWLEQEAK